MDFWVVLGWFLMDFWVVLGWFLGVFWGGVGWFWMVFGWFLDGVVFDCFWGGFGWFLGGFWKVFCWFLGSFLRFFVRWFWKNTPVSTATFCWKAFGALGNIGFGIMFVFWMFDAT